MRDRLLAAVAGWALGKEGIAASPATALAHRTGLRHDPAKSQEDRPCRCPRTQTPRRPKHLRDKYAIVGVGETTYTRGSGMTTRALGTWAVRNAIEDAGLKAVRRRRHAVLPVGRFDLRDLHRRRSRHPAQLLHGRVRRRLLDRGADRHRHRRDRGRHVQDGRDLPRHERLQPGAHRRHRRARGGAGRGRHAAQPRLRLAERGPDVQPHLHAPHVRLRHDAGAGRGACKRGPQRARLQQPQGLLQEARDGRGRAGEPHHLQAAASARLLRGDRQRHRHHRHQRRARRATAAIRAR